jgi:hypothetical protein
VLVDAVFGAVAVGEAGAEGVALALPRAHPRLRRQHPPAVAAVQVYYTHVGRDRAINASRNIKEMKLDRKELLMMNRNNIAGRRLICGVRTW